MHQPEPSWPFGAPAGPAWCAARGGALEVHHVVKRAQGGSDFDLDRLVALCPPCHAQTDAPYVRGRLVITAIGNGRFTVEVIRGADKGRAARNRRRSLWPALSSPRSWSSSESPDPTPTRRRGTIYPDRRRSCRAR
jgi:hypothetical protein